MEGDTESPESLQFTTSSTSVNMAMPGTGTVVRESSGSSSRSIQSPKRHIRKASRDRPSTQKTIQKGTRRVSPSPQRPPLGLADRDDMAGPMTRIVPMDVASGPQGYPSSSSVGPEVSQGPNVGHSHATYQQYQDHRSLHFHGNPEQLTRETANVVSGVVHQANQAVSQARMSEALAHERASTISQSAQNQMHSMAQEANGVLTSVRAEATQAVASARVEATEALARSGTLEAVVQQLQSRLDSMTSENQWLRDQLSTSPAVPVAHDNETTNATNYRLILDRLTSIEHQIHRIENKLDTHQDYIQELWMQQAPPPDVVIDGGNTPVIRMDHQDAHPQGFQMHDEDDDVEVHSQATSVGDVESRNLRLKDLHHLKLPSLPESASQFRSWKNSVRTTIMSYDHSAEGLVGQWLSVGFTARGAESDRLRTSSGDFPRLDRVLASVLCKSETMRTSFGLRIQAYIESCESVNEQVRGRYIINLVSCEYDTSAAAGAITSSLELFQLPIPQDSAAALRVWHDRAVYILSQLPTVQRPTESLMQQWIYASLKKHPLMRRVIDRYHDAPLNGYNRSFEALWRGVEVALLESQHDANAASLKEDLKKGPLTIKKASAAVAKGKGSEKGTKGNPKSDTKAPYGSSSSNQQGKGKGKHDNKGKKDQGKEKPQGSGPASSTNGKPKQLSPAEKAKAPCIYHAKGRCMRGDACPYSHAVTASASTKGQSNSPSGTAKVAAAVAILATSAVAETHSGFLEFVGDTGAGENLGSVEAFRKQGLNLPADFVTTSSQPMQFMTGGGHQPGANTVGFWSQEFDRFHNTYLLPNCPLALSIGQLCSQGYTFLWEPSTLPMLIPPTSRCDVTIEGDIIQAARIDHHVPIFRLSIQCTHGLPAQSVHDVPVGGGDTALSSDEPSSLKPAVHAPGAGGGGGDDPKGLPAEPLRTAVPAPGAGGGDQGEADQQEIIEDQLEREEEGLGKYHLMTHLPKSLSCDTCKQAKLHESHHRRHENMNVRIREARAAERPTKYLEKVSIDHIVTRDEVGNRGEQYTLVMVDQFTGLVSLYPSRTKSAEEIEDALRRWVGKRRPGVVQVASDRAPEFRKALDNLGFAKEPAAPNQRLHNSIAESMVRTIKGMTTSILLHSGIEPQYWPLAQKYLEWAFNISTPAVGDWGDDEPPSRYEAAMGYAVDFYMIPFGAMVWYKNHDVYSYSPKGEPALFLGGEFTDGLLFKGNYRVWPLDAFVEGVCKEVVIKSIAVPTGDWKFPAKSRNESVLALEKSMPDDIEYEPSILEDSHEIGDPESPHIFSDGEQGDEPAVVDPPVSSEPKTRRRNITSLRIAAYGKTPGCEGCRTEVHLHHTKECRDRFDSLLEAEPIIKRTSAAVSESAKVDRHATVGGVESDLFGLTAPATGREVRQSDLERGQDVVMSIYMQAIDEGMGEEETLTQKLALISQSQAQPKPIKKGKKNKWFVEFCCSDSSACSRVAEACKIPYLGLSESFGDLTDPVVFDQVLFWFEERIQKGEAIDLWGSIPCGPYSPLQNLNLATQGPKYQEMLDDKRAITDTLLQNYIILAKLAVRSGGSASFEWPLRNGGWLLDEVVSMIVDLNMFSCHPSGCGMGLVIDGKYPLKEWRVVTTNQRVAAHLDKFRCQHPPGHKHDPIEGGRMAKLSGIYNIKMAISILSPLNPHAAFTDIPALPTVHGAIAHQEKGLWMAQLVLGMVHTPLTRQQLFSHPEGRQKIAEEANEMRKMQVWDDDDVHEVDELKRQARENGQVIHVAEIMAIGSIKHPESKERSLLKVRLVFRGDDTRDQNNQLALFRELKSIPATIATVHIVLWYGLRPKHKSTIADARKAYLQAPLGTDVPTYVILPRETWKPHWSKRYHRVAARLRKALYGHPTSGDDWGDYLDSVVVVHLQGERVEGWPSLWFIKSCEVLVAAYVDDLVVSGPSESVDLFWELLSAHIQVESVEEPGRYLGRDHIVFHYQGVKKIHMSMTDYAVTAYKLYEDQFHKELKVYDTPYVTEAALTAEGYEEKGQLEGHAAQLLMKLLWLSRLSRPDLSFAITSLASNISRWSRNHDLMLYRLLGYVKGTVSLGIMGFVSPNPEVPTLLLYADADLAGDPLTMKSHSGHYVVIVDSHGTSFPVLWSAKKQSCVSRSTTEAEMVSAATLIFDDGIPIKTVLETLMDAEVNTVLKEDNTAVGTIINNGYSPKLRSLNRTHRISVAAVSEVVKNGLVEVEITPTDEQLGDIFTKTMPRPKFLQARDDIQVCPCPVGTKET